LHIMRIFIVLICCVLMTVVFTSCKRRSSLRNEIRGTVTWKGKPIPGGMVTFAPNGVKGNRGPQGFAMIKNGKFDTAEAGKGIVKGAVIISISATDGKPIGEFSLGKPLFTPPSVISEMEIPTDLEKLKLEIPESAVLLDKNTVLQ
jgi:hypothetical protein